MDEPHQYAMPGGYDQVVTALAEKAARHGVEIRTRAEVGSIRWRRGEVEVLARGSRRQAGRKFTARALVVTVPLGVLQARRGPGALRFDPPLRQQQRWIDGMEMGHVVRLAVRFDARSWRRLAASFPARVRSGFGFVHSLVEGVPVWWSLADDPLLVGWAGGPAARALLRLSPATRRRRALQSLGKILGVPAATLRRAVENWEGWDWTHDPYSRGAYSFTAAGQDATAAKLRQPIQGTIFFAGEAVAEGAEVGTVHGALSSGLRAAREIGREARRLRGTTK